MEDAQPEWMPWWEALVRREGKGVANGGGAGTGRDVLLPSFGSVSEIQVTPGVTNCCEGKTEM